MSIAYAFVLTGNVDWRQSIGNDWDLDSIILEGNEPVIGHHKIDGVIVKVIKLSDGKLAALTK
jgi:hypothetical protein